MLLQHHHALGLWNLPAGKLPLFEFGKHGTNAKSQLLEVDVVDPQLKSNLLDKGTVAKITTVENFIAIVIRLTTSDGSV